MTSTTTTTPNGCCLVPATSSSPNGAHQHNHHHLNCHHQMDESSRGANNFAPTDYKLNFMGKLVLNREHHVSSAQSTHHHHPRMFNTLEQNKSVETTSTITAITRLGDPNQDETIDTTKRKSINKPISQFQMHSSSSTSVQMSDHPEDREPLLINGSVHSTTNSLNDLKSKFESINQISSSVAMRSQAPRTATNVVRSSFSSASQHHFITSNNSDHNPKQLPTVNSNETPIRSLASASASSTTLSSSKMINKCETGEIGVRTSPPVVVSRSTGDVVDESILNTKSSIRTSCVLNGDGLVTPKQHSAKCNIMLRKMRRGNKRSKSLPSKFNIDSVLDYLNYSMILNKYELRKQLSQQRALIFTHHNYNSYNNPSSNTSSSSQAHNQLNNPKSSMLRSRVSSHQHHQLSSGYNSQNHSNSSQITTATSTNASQYRGATNNDEYLALFNFYRLTLNHLPANFSNTLCTCSAAGNGVGNNRKSTSSKTTASNPVSSSPIIPGDDDEIDEDDFDEEDEDLEEDIMDEEEEPSPPANVPNSPKLSKPPSSSVIQPDIDSNRFRRAPGTSTCPHTAKIDIRRVRSYQDLTQVQRLYTVDDFVFKEKLGEGFFANVKKIVSKITRQEMVLKELKLGCVESGVDCEPEQASSSAKTFNYAELHAAHKSFLKEAQVLRNLNHPNVIKLLGILFTKQKHLNLVLEFIGGGTLKDIIHNISIGLPWKLRVGYARDIAAAMQYLHSLNIIHRDLKSDNCLVRENGRSVVVADFGLSQIINQYNTSSGSNGASGKKVVGNRNNNTSAVDESFLRVTCNTINTSALANTPVQSGTNSFIVAAKRKLKRRGENHQRKQRYAVVGNSFSMAPEMLKHEIYDERVDIFSFGIICCEIIGRVQADPDYLPRTSDFGLNVELFRKKYCEADCPKHFIKIAIACCELEPEKRPPFAKNHVWLETILSHLEANNPIPKNLLKNILESNTKRLTLPTNPI